jgi:hypothetical protein
MNADIEMADVVVFVYTLGVMVTGLFVGTGGNPTITPINGAAGLLVALLWTVYFEWRVAPRVFDWELREERDDESDESVSDDTASEEESGEKPDQPAPWDQ